MNRLIKPGRVTALLLLMFLILSLYMVFLYKLQIVEGEIYYNKSSEITNERRTVTAERGSILDRYGRVLVGNKECYNLKVDNTKLFANDVGLLAAMYAGGIQLRLLAGESGLNIGAVYENVVAQELLAKGLSPYYYHSKKRGELDFVVERAGGVTPIEVKSGKDYKRHNALSNVLSDANYEIDEAFVLSNENLERVGRVTYLPIYMVMFMAATDLPERLIYRV